MEMDEEGLRAEVAALLQGQEFANISQLAWDFAVDENSAAGDGGEEASIAEAAGNTRWERMMAMTENELEQELHARGVRAAHCPAIVWRRCLIASRACRCRLGHTRTFSCTACACSAIGMVDEGISRHRD